MSMGRVANVCAHLRNVSNARLALTSVPLSKKTWQLACAMQDAGFFSGVIPGSDAPPPMHLVLNYPSINDEERPIEKLTRENIASSRIWLGMKYWQGEPVIREIEPVSQPKRKITLSVSELRDVIRGKKRGMVNGLRSPGECMFLLTSEGLMEARDCIEKNVGGLVLLRVS
jgi:ribosomal protein S8